MTNKNYCDCRKGRDPCTCKAVEPVPPVVGEQIEVSRDFLKRAREKIRTTGIVFDDQLDTEFKRYLGELAPPSLEEYRKFMMDKGIDWDSEPEAHFYLHPEKEGENAVWCRLVRGGQEYKAAIPSKLFGDWKPNKDLDNVSLSKFTRRPGLDNIFIPGIYGDEI